MQPIHVYIKFTRHNFSARVKLRIVVSFIKPGMQASDALAYPQKSPRNIHGRHFPRPRLNKKGHALGSVAVHNGTVPLMTLSLGDDR